MRVTPPEHTTLKASASILVIESGPESPCVAWSIGVNMTQCLDIPSARLMSMSELRGWLLVQLTSFSRA
jgi:hypothetical protein